MPGPRAGARANDRSAPAVRRSRGGRAGRALAPWILLAPLTPLAAALVPLALRVPLPPLAPLGLGPLAPFGPGPAADARAAPGLFGAQDPAWGAREEAVHLVLVRHAEKEAVATPDPALTIAGRARSKELARILEHAGVTRLFASDTRRARETLEPLADATGAEIETYDPRDASVFAERLAGLAGGSVAVVAGHSNTLGPLAAAFGGRLSGLDEAGHLPEDEYDRLVLVTLPAGDAPPAVLELAYGAPTGP